MYLMMAAWWQEHVVYSDSVNVKIKVQKKCCVGKEKHTVKCLNYPQQDVALQNLLFVIHPLQVYSYMSV
jgi:hypothetical protein